MSSTSSGNFVRRTSAIRSSAGITSASGAKRAAAFTNDGELASTPNLRAPDNPSIPASESPITRGFQVAGNRSSQATEGGIPASQLESR